MGLPLGSVALHRPEVFLDFHQAVSPEVGHLDLLAEEDRREDHVSPQLLCPYTVGY